MQVSANPSIWNEADVESGLGVRQPQAGNPVNEELAMLWMGLQLHGAGLVLSPLLSPLHSMQC